MAEEGKTRRAGEISQRGKWLNGFLQRGKWSAGRTLPSTVLMFHLKLGYFCNTFCESRHQDSFVLFALSTYCLPLSDTQSASQEYTTYACDGNLLRLECPSESDVIRVTRANYGR